MMEKAGYLQQTRYRAQDSEGTAHDVVELHILGNRYAIRRADLIKAVSGRVFVQVEDSPTTGTTISGRPAALRMSRHRAKP